MVLTCFYRILNKRYSLKTLSYIQNVNVIQRYSTDIDNQNREKWDLFSAVSLERKPVIARKLNDLEQKMFELLRKIELENSSKSNHEYQIVMDKLKLEELKKGKSKINLDNIPEKTAQDFEDASLKELSNFGFADRETEGDRTKDIKSAERCLDRSLLLLVKEKIGNKQYWILPHGIRQDGETLRQTAERILVEKCGPELKASFFGNAPVGFYKYKYPTTSRTEAENSAVGAKIFFFKAQLKEGNVTLDSKLITDYQWATKSELRVHLVPNYYKSISMFLIDEEH
ncbi:mitochondrial ribosomal protein L46 [Lycorma delicatula]|uniref:mitochondrial ribosomal protein L46 n=1 Tax=Lycorma delicatula TaxID=130591 RepID=UPI003F513564